MNRSEKKKSRKSRLGWGLTAAAVAYAGAAVYFRFRPQPPGINASQRSYSVPHENIKFFQDTTWFEYGQRQNVRQIAPAVIQQIERSRRFIVMDVFLFSHHHIDKADDYIPTTRQVVDALAIKSANNIPIWFITDPINTTYGTVVTEPIRWLKEAGVKVCITDIRRLRDNTLLYAPFWRLCLQWIKNTTPPRIENPLEAGTKTTPWALLEALNIRANHRKLLIADDGDSHVTLISSSNFEDASSYFGNTAIAIKDDRVAHHVLEAEKALAHASGVDIPIRISAPKKASSKPGNAQVTPLMGRQIRAAILKDLNEATSADRLYILCQYLSSRKMIDALIRASRRGVRGTLVLDRSKISFGSPKRGYPNQMTGVELMQKTQFEVRWANSGGHEYHNQFIFLQKPRANIIHAGSTNFNRRALSNTILETNIRVEASPTAAVSQQIHDYVKWMIVAPRSLPFEEGSDHPGAMKYWFYRFQEATGAGSF